jgi:hypothetical protein
MRVTNLASADAGFKEVKTFNLYSPDDLETR